MFAGLTKYRYGYSLSSINFFFVTTVVSSILGASITINSTPCSFALIAAFFINLVNEVPFPSTSDKNKL